MSGKKLAVLFLYLMLSVQLFAGGVLSSPRKVYVVKTNHFEIMFSKESAETARFIADNADSLYEKAKEATGAVHDFSMPIIISPDSDELDVSYTTSPYNRIVVFDSLESYGLTDDYSSLLTCLYREIFEAVSCSIRSGFNHVIYKTIGGDSYQPISLLNLPFSFVQANVDISTGCLNDAYYQQLLIQAKLENNFPSWFQASALRDIYPGDDICYAAASGFSAYLMQTYGVEKYSEFWNECGGLNPFFMSGIFYKIYGEFIGRIWNQFKESVPLPADTQQLENFEELSSEVFNTDSQRLFSNILYTKFGVVWYDAMCHEVDIFDSNNVFGLRQLLFIAEEIDRLTLSPDGRYILVSFTRTEHRKEFKKNVTRIYDLKEREFLDYKFDLRDSSFVNDTEGNLCIAGICINDKLPLMQVYRLKDDSEETELIYEKQFERSYVPHHLCFAGNGKICYLVKDDKQMNLCMEDFAGRAADYENPAGSASTLIAKNWKLCDSDESNIIPVSLSFMDLNDGKTRGYSFTYFPHKEGELARAGFISVDNAYNPVELYLQSCDISGGVYYPVFNETNLYYCAKKSTHDELRFLPLKEIPFTQGTLEQINVELPVYEHPGEKLFSDDMRQLGNYEIKKYNPLKYIVHMSATPFLAIRDINVEDGMVLWPSLGLALDSGSDPMENTKFYLSGSADFLIYSFKKYFRGKPKEESQLYEENTGGSRQFNLAAYIMNSSTPVDISAGAIFEADRNGQYDFKGVAKTDWKIPVGKIIRNLDFSISGIYKASTVYYDLNKTDVYKPLEGWTPLWNAYELLEVSAKVQYSNSHQYGISRYERRGITLGGRFYSLWDIYELRQLNEFRENEQQKIKDGTAELTAVQLQNIYEENMFNISQLNLGLFLTVEIPRLTPLEIYKGWVFSVPAQIHAEFLNKPGTALEAGAEILLLGNEIQNGIPSLYLFFSRAGLKAGYNLCMIYDTTMVQLPDIRKSSSYAWNVLAQSHAYDSVYLLLNTDFLIPAGYLSKIQFSVNSKIEYFIRAESFKFSLLFNASF